MNKELRNLSRAEEQHEEQHMDKEFEDYDKLYPREWDEDRALVRAIKEGEDTESISRRKFLISLREKRTDS